MTWQRSASSAVAPRVGTCEAVLPVLGTFNAAQPCPRPSVTHMHTSLKSSSRANLCDSSPPLVPVEHVAQLMAAERTGKTCCKRERTCRSSGAAHQFNEAVCCDH